ncbi:hypothetical protein H4R23_003379 [Coemansia sp. Cherry 401B]|nr:hypothetical protein H4R23_003379 [Coemansia sp. Cherry 401B]
MVAPSSSSEHSDSEPPPATRGRQPRRGEAEVEERRRQNRDAAARHRQRQQSRLDELARREAILQQQVGELEVEIETLKRGRAGLPLPERDPFTATVRELLQSVDALRASLHECCEDSQLLVNEQVADAIVRRRQAEPPGEAMLAKSRDGDSGVARRTRSSAAAADARRVGDVDNSDDDGDDDDSDCEWQGAATSAAPGARQQIRAPSPQAPADSKRAHSPRTARRIRNRQAAARMRDRQRHHLAELEKRKEVLERRAAQLEEELRVVQRQNNPLNSSIDKLTEMIEDLTKVEYTMLDGIDECKQLLGMLESLYKQRL